MEKQRIKGTIFNTVTNPDKGGFGFIISKELPYEKIYFHWTQLNTNTKRFLALKSGDEVEFDLVNKEGYGYQAHRIEVTEDAIVTNIPEAKVERIK